MTAATYTTNISNIYTSDSEDDTNWTGLGGGPAGLNIPETDYYIQGTACATKNAFASSTRGMIRDSSSDEGGSGTDGAYVAWMTHTAPNSLATKANGGMQFLIGSSTSDYNQYYVGGSDTMTFQGWEFVAVSETIDGDTSTGTPSTTVEQTFGGLWNLPSGGPTKGAPNAIDGIRFGRCDIVIEYGDVSPNGPATFDDVITDLETPTNRYGMLAQRVPGGAFENSGLIQFGSTTNAVRFEDSNKTINIRNHDHVTTNFNTWEVKNASSVVNFTNLVVQALGTTSPGRWITTDNADLNWDSCSWTDLGTFGFDSNSTIDTNIFRRCGQVTQNGATLTECTIDSSAAATAGSPSTEIAALLSDNPSLITDCSFISDGTGHAVEVGSDVVSGSPAAGTYNWSGNTDSGYTGTRGSNLVESSGSANAMFYNNSGGHITLNVINGGQSLSVRNGAGSTTTVSETYTHTLTDLAENTEVTYVLAGSPQTVVFHVENVSASGETTYNHGGGELVNILIHHLDKLPDISCIYDLTLPSSDTTVKVQQFDDPNYIT